jgi:hypothetical protein
MFTAPEPEGVGPEKYDETAMAMIAELKYGSGMPLNPIENLEKQLGVPLPAATQWEIVEEPLSRTLAGSSPVFPHREA